jgi:hypothetical protein
VNLRGKDSCLLQYLFFLTPVKSLIRPNIIRGVIIGIHLDLWAASIQKKRY